MFYLLLTFVFTIGANTGGGGGGGGQGNGGSGFGAVFGGQGGSGVVIVSYPAGFKSASTTGVNLHRPFIPTFIFFPSPIVFGFAVR